MGTPKQKVEFFFDYGSTFSYLAWVALPAFAQRTGAEIVLRPMLIGGLFKLTGNHPPFVDVPAKGAWLFKDLARSAKRAGIPFRMNSKFPVPTLGLMRGAIVAEELGMLHPYSAAVFNAMWRDDEDMGDPRVVGRVLDAAGIDARLVARRIEEAPVKEKLKSNTGEAAARGAFGAPTFFVGEEMFWGFDRMDQVAEALH